MYLRTLSWVPSIYWVRLCLFNLIFTTGKGQLLFHIRSHWYAERLG